MIVGLRVTLKRETDIHSAVLYPMALFPITINALPPILYNLTLQL